MVTFNGETYLRDQIESILIQSPPPDELVIGDDGSVDGTVALIRELTRHSPIPITMIGGDHVGLRLNVQRTIEACTGDVIALADQDDVWLPGKLAAIHEAFLADEVTLWFSDAELTYETGQMMGERLWQRVNLTPDGLSADVGAQDTLRRLLVGQTVAGATMAFRATLRNLVLPLPPELEGEEPLYLHDGWITVLAWLLGRHVADPRTRILYRRHPRQFTATPEPPMGQVDAAGAMEAPPRTARIERRPLVARRELMREHARARLVLERIRTTDSLDACRPLDARTLVEVEAFLRTRTLPPGAPRVFSILRQVALRRYSRYARGWRTAAADLFASRA